MAFLDNTLGTDIYGPEPSPGQTEPITFWPELYGDAMGSVAQWDSRDVCSNSNQAQFRAIAENMDDQGAVVSYAV